MTAYTLVIGRVLPGWAAVVLAACGTAGVRPAPVVPASASPPPAPSAVPASTTGSAAASPDTPPSAPSASTGSPPPAPPSCSGDSVDLDALFAAAACIGEGGLAVPDKSDLAIRVAAASPSVAAGDGALLTVSLVNQTDRSLQVALSDHFGFWVSDAAGKRADVIEECPGLFGLLVPLNNVYVTLSPHGEAHKTLRFVATTERRGCSGHRVEPMKPGPYQLVVVTPLNDCSPKHVLECLPRTGQTPVRVVKASR
jgi:hypothetical protein